MTSPAHTGRPAAAGTNTGGTARWLNLVTAIVLVATGGVVLFAAAPSLLRAGIGAASEGQDFPPPVRAHNPTLVPQHHPGSHRGFEFAPDSRDDEDDDVDSPPRGAPPPRDPWVKPRRIPAGDDDGPGGLGIRSGITLRPLVLRDRRSGSILHEVRTGQSVAVLREDDDWVLVAHENDAKVVTGWARKSELLLR